MYGKFSKTILNEIQGELLYGKIPTRIYLFCLLYAENTLQLLSYPGYNVTPLPPPPLTQWQTVKLIILIRVYKHILQDSTTNV